MTHNFDTFEHLIGAQGSREHIDNMQLLFEQDSKKRQEATQNLIRQLFSHTPIDIGRRSGSYIQKPEMCVKNTRNGIIVTLHDESFLFSNEEKRNDPFFLEKILLLEQSAKQHATDGLSFSSEWQTEENAQLILRTRRRLTDEIGQYLYPKREKRIEAAVILSSAAMKMSRIPFSLGEAEKHQLMRQRGDHKFLRGYYDTSQYRNQTQWNEERGDFIASQKPGTILVSGPVKTKIKAIFDHASLIVEGGNVTELRLKGGLRKINPLEMEEDVITAITLPFSDDPDAILSMQNRVRSAQVLSFQYIPFASPLTREEVNIQKLILAGREGYQANCSSIIYDILQGRGANSLPHFMISEQGFIAPKSLLPEFGNKYTHHDIAPWEYTTETISRYPTWR